jgi:hypothetical protein
VLRILEVIVRSMVSDALRILEVIVTSAVLDVLRIWR